MTEEKKTALAVIEEKREEICGVADQIWEYAELSLKEFRSANLYCETLEKEGFHVEKGISGIETAFSASYGSGRPLIGILAEYDALSGLSQVAGSTERKERVAGGTGHGCGHNLLGAGAFAATLAVKAYLEKTKTPGTVVLYGCPGEEGGAAKAFMARDGGWKDLDAALTWHPEDVNEVATGSSNSCIQVQYKFTGIASHAAGAPERGRSALDAVELMNIGVQFLREHMSDKARVHYAITDAGGCSPNVVQPRASVLYMVRSNHVSEAIELQKRVDRIAEGAALMTDTTIERKFIDGLSDTVSNFALERVLYKNFSEIGVPTYTEEENAFADALSKTYAGNDRVPGVAAENDSALREEVMEKQAKVGHAMNAFLAPLYQGEAFKAGSTDVGDVSWLTPTAQIHVASWPNGCPGHSWQNVSCDRTEIGHKAVICAGKVLAGTAIDLFTDPELLNEARKEFEKRTAEGFVSPIPADAVPVVPDLG
ncbi:M20 family metallopeptidase [Brotaphodocola sp.]|uniref:M20 family metallopeptidase n=1 Tax=Brotaphodocola sp. TaxID=3073577 RepID=UPI003D7DB5FD